MTKFFMSIENNPGFDLVLFPLIYYIGGISSEEMKIKR